MPEPGEISKSCVIGDYDSVGSSAWAGKCWPMIDNSMGYVRGTLCRDFFKLCNKIWKWIL